MRSGTVGPTPRRKRGSGGVDGPSSGTACRVPEFINGCHQFVIRPRLLCNGVSVDHAMISAERIADASLWLIAE